MYHSGFLCGYIEFIIMVWNGIWTKLIWKIKKKKEREKQDAHFEESLRPFQLDMLGWKHIFLLELICLQAHLCHGQQCLKKIIGGTKIEMLSIMWCVKSASCSFPSEPFHQSQIQDKSKLNWVSKLSVFRWLWCIGSWGKSCQILCNWHFYMHLVFVLDMSMY